MDHRSEVQKALREPIVEFERLPLQTVSTPYRVKLANGRQVFAKVYPPKPNDLVEAEVASLKALAQTESVKLPALVGQGPNVLVLEWIESRPKSTKAAEKLGRALGVLHQRMSTLFGFSCDTYTGLVMLPNDWEGTGPQFYRQKRLLPALKRIKQRQELSAPEIGILEALVAGLEKWLPDEQPSLLHGNLSPQNALFGPNDDVYLIDPATHFGYREFDLATSQLYGGFESRFYAAYQEVFPVDRSYKERKDLYSLVHVFNFAAEAGGKYAKAAVALSRKYVG